MATRRLERFREWRAARRRKKAHTEYSEKQAHKAQRDFTDKHGLTPPPSGGN
jgi:hypothetical protein